MHGVRGTDIDNEHVTIDIQICDTKVPNKAKESHSLNIKRMKCLLNRMRKIKILHYNVP